LPTQFSQTTRSLANDRSPAPILAWLLATVLLCGWSLWFAFGDVTVYETSRKARLEVVQLPHHVAAPLSGRVTSSSVVIGQEVVANQVLIELDASAETFRLAEEETRLVSLPPRIAYMQTERISLEQAKHEDLRATQAALHAAGARVKEADATVKFARNNESRLKRQSVVGGVAEIDALRAVSEADKLSASKDAMTADLKHLEQDGQMRGHESQARIENLRPLSPWKGRWRQHAPPSRGSSRRSTSTSSARRSRAALVMSRRFTRVPMSPRVGGSSPWYRRATS
jgi:membrane fusion protein, adhesin transport system